MAAEVEEYKSIALQHLEVRQRKRYHLGDDGPIELKPPLLAREIAEIVTSPHNQDSRSITVGAQGKGKSTFNIYLGYRVAEEIAKIKGGVWQDYFNENNIAVAVEEDILDKMEVLKKYNVYLLDDVGKAWGARNFMSQLNKFMNDVFQLMRTDNCFVMISIISAFLVDKVPRNLVNRLIEMNVSLYDYGLVFPKIFNVVQRPRYGGSHMVYPRYGNSIVVRYVGKLPPDELMEGYLIKREEATKMIRQRKKEEEKEGDKKFTKKEFYYPFAWKLIHEEHWTQKKACEFAGVESTSHYREWEKTFEP